jgi:hypothetical protein
MTTESARCMRASLEKTGRTFGQTLPVIVGMLLLSSLALTLFAPEQFARLFGRNDWLDALLGTALVVRWVTVGLVQLPAEALFLGRRFALMRNLVAFVFTIAVAWLTVQTLRGFGTSLP